MAFLPVTQCLHKLGEVCTQFQEKNSHTFCYAWCLVLGPIYILHSSRHVHNLMKSQLYANLSSKGCLVLPLLVTEFKGLCMQFDEKQLCTLVAYSMDSKPYIKPVKGCLILPSLVQLGLYTILGKASYTLIRLTNMLLPFCTQF